MNGSGLSERQVPRFPGFPLPKDRPLRIISRRGAVEDADSTIPHRSCITRRVSCPVADSCHVVKKELEYLDFFLSGPESVKITVFEGMDDPAPWKLHLEGDLRLGGGGIERYLRKSYRVECPPFFIEEDCQPANGVFRRVRVGADGDLEKSAHPSSANRTYSALPVAA